MHPHARLPPRFPASAASAVPRFRVQPPRCYNPRRRRSDADRDQWDVLGPADGWQRAVSPRAARRVAARRAAIGEAEKRARHADETQVFIETPYRNDTLLADLLATCRPATRLCVAADLTAPGEWIRSDAVEAWRAAPSVIGKRPAIFLLLA